MTTRAMLSVLNLCLLSQVIIVHHCLAHIIWLIVKYRTMGEVISKYYPQFK
jgi:hypothetical protein